MKRTNRRTSSAFTASAFVATAATSLALLLAPPAAASPGSWELTGCSADPEGTLRSKLRIHNQDTAKPHSYDVKIVWNQGSDRLASTEMSTGTIEPGQAQDVDASTQAGVPLPTVAEQAEQVSCVVEYIRDEQDQEVGS